MNRSIVTFITVIAVLLTACGEQEAAKQQGADIPFKPTGDVLHLMHWVLEPAADKIWDSAGQIITAEGERDLRPTTDEGWLAVEQSATVVAETGNLLLMPGYARDEGDWRELSLALIDAGLRAKAAAAAQDGDQLFDDGGHLYRVCVSCHSVYVQGLPTPSSSPLRVE